MMSIKKLLLGAVTAQALLASVAMAQTSPPPVVTLTEVTPAPGKTVAAQVLLPDGTSVPAKVGMSLPNGTQLIVLEGASVKGVYDKEQCQQTYGSKTRLEVDKTKPCSVGTQISETTTRKITTSKSTVEKVLTDFVPPVEPNTLKVLAPLAAVTFISAFSADSINDKPKTK